MQADDLPIGPPPPPPPTPPTAVVSSTTMLTIGAQVVASVSSQTPLVQVTYAITGAGGGIASQVWTPQLGTYKRTSGTAHTFTAPGTPTDSWTFFWDEVPGMKTVTISAVDNQGNSWTGTYGPYNVAAPVASNFTVNLGIATIGQLQLPKGTSTFGFFVTTPGAGGVNQPGVTYSAIIQNTNDPATGGFLQLVNFNSVQHYVTSTDTQTQTQSTDGATVLDAPDGPPGDPVLYGNWSMALPPGLETQIQSMPQQNMSTVWPTDAPGQPLNPPSNGLYVTSLLLCFFYVTDVDYQVNGGIHIELATIDWSVEMDATYIGPQNPTTAVYEDPVSWSVSQTIRPGTPTYGPFLETWNGDKGQFQPVTTSP